MNSDKHVLPENFDGVFRFTNFTKSDFKAKWNNTEYTFPAESTTPMVMNATPEEIQTIRKKFARELAIQEFYNTKKFKELNKHVPGGVPANYTDSDLAEFVQKCLDPLPPAQMKVKPLPKADESRNRRDEEGELVTKPLDKKTSLLKQGSGVIES